MADWIYLPLVVLVVLVVGAVAVSGLYALFNAVSHRVRLRRAHRD